MYFAAKQQKDIIINMNKKAKINFDLISKKFFHYIPTKYQQWAWFIILWFTGLIGVLILTYPIKILFKMIK